MQNLKNIQSQQPQQRIAQTNRMLKQAFPNQQYEVRDERQADAVLSELGSSPYASQFDTYFGESTGQANQSQQSAQQSGGAEHIGGSSKSASNNTWGSEATTWLHDNQSRIENCLK